ncbi:MAG: hypothetical protein KKA32_08605 [Actinobacteria bacterium]|nr:hypothetical protein [Actinomycetota bacterium]
MAIDETGGVLYVAESGNNRVQTFATETGISTWPTRCPPASRSSPRAETSSPTGRLPRTALTSRRSRPYRV